MRRITGIGQYVAVDSPVHRLDAAAKIGIVAAFTVGLFLVRDRDFVGLAFMAGCVALVIAASRVPPRALARGLRAIGLFLAFTILANALRLSPATEALLRVGPVAVDAHGLYSGVFFAARIVLLVAGTSLLTLTTSPIELTSGIERAFGPLKLARVPVGDLAMTLSIALRFIPTTAEEAYRIMTAQQARGASFDRGGPIARARAYVPVLVPLFYQLFRRADALATAMEARCYAGTEGRTRLDDARMRAADWLTLVLAGVVLIGVRWVL